MAALEGKTALITGGARGQGRAHATTLAREGADIVVCDVASPLEEVDYPLATPADLEQTVQAVQALGRRCLAITADVRDLAAMQDVVSQAITTFGGIDVAIANAGIASSAPLATMSARRWQTMLDVNLTGVFNTFRAVLPHMIERGAGRLVATSSIVAGTGATNGPLRGGQGRCGRAGEVGGVRGRRTRHHGQRGAAVGGEHADDPQPRDVPDHPAGSGEPEPRGRRGDVRAGTPAARIA
jgi:NAD(P)-dependent dehydrogenase (short-subunit alcohol dehydrogenase family)